VDGIIYGVEDGRRGFGLMVLGLLRLLLRGRLLGRSRLRLLLLVVRMLGVVGLGLGLLRLRQPLRRLRGHVSRGSPRGLLERGSTCSSHSMSNWHQFAHRRLISADTAATRPRQEVLTSTSLTGILLSRTGCTQMPAAAAMKTSHGGPKDRCFLVTEAGNVPSRPKDHLHCQPSVPFEHIATSAPIFPQAEISGSAEPG